MKDAIQPVRNARRSFVGKTVMLKRQYPPCLLATFQAWCLSGDPSRTQPNFQNQLKSWQVFVLTNFSAWNGQFIALFSTPNEIA
jgi:hypothetical protein